MTFDQFTNSLVPSVALGLVVFSTAQLFTRRDRFWPFRLGQTLLCLGVFVLSANLVFGRDYAFAIATLHITVACCVAGGVLVVASGMWNGEPTN